ATGIKILHLRNPGVVSWWSAAFPGAGHLLLGATAEGMFLMVWEIWTNLQAKINTTIFFSMTGRFDQAREVLDTRWLLLYVPVYVFALWDSYRQTLELNKYSILADREDSTVNAAKIGTLSLNFLDKRNPWAAAAWSLLAPGTGHVHLGRLHTGLFILVWWIVMAYFSQVAPAIHCTAVGDFAGARAVADPQWLLFIPSLYGFAAYDAYASAVEVNRLFEVEQAKFLKDNYQQPGLEAALARGGQGEC
ncbi:MAG: hypothetical protein QHH02_05725, partial [Syntrophomonadaceae bacterium]|nr:hypothetical protein [Syntrophomonadaceae bacterium]